MRKLLGAFSVLLLASCLGYSQKDDPASTTASSPGQEQTANRPGDVAPRDRDNNWGWIGIAGLAGLAGLMGRRNRAITSQDYNRDRRPGDIRRAA
jgi:hypothetical protein